MTTSRTLTRLAKKTGERKESKRRNWEGQKAPRTWNLCELIKRTRRLCQKPNWRQINHHEARRALASVAEKLQEAESANCHRPCPPKCNMNPKLTRSKTCFGVLLKTWALEWLGSLIGDPGVKIARILVALPLIRHPFVGKRTGYIIRLGCLVKITY